MHEGSNVQCPLVDKPLVTQSDEIINITEPKARDSLYRNLDDPSVIITDYLFFLKTIFILVCSAFVALNSDSPPIEVIFLFGKLIVMWHVLWHF